MLKNFRTVVAGCAAFAVVLAGCANGPTGPGQTSGDNASTTSPFVGP